MSRIKLSRVTKVFESDSRRNDDVRAVDNFDLEIEDGELLVLLGPSGCGKTTILRMVAGLEVPTSGDIIIGDKIVTDLHSKERGIAMVFQDYALYPHMTVRENMSFGLENMKFKKTEIATRVSETSKLLDLESLLDRKPKEISGGQRQRVALGRAIVRKPEVYLFDEPLSNLDAKLRLKMRLELRRLQKELAVTSIYVTHDQIEAMTLGERIVIMNEGVLQQVGTPEEIYNKPINLFVAGFIGSPPMNLIEGNVVKVEGNYGIKIDTNVYGFGSLYSHLNKYQDKSIIIGIRPSDFIISKSDENRISNKFTEGKIQIIEYLGNSNFIYIEDKRHLIVVETESKLSFKQGDHVKLYLEPKDALFFDDDSGYAI